MAEFIYGIDFGTSNSVLSILNTRSGEIVKVYSEPSVIYFPENHQYSIGKEAVNLYVQNNMKGRFLKSVKTLLPQSNFSFTYIYGKKYTAEDLVFLILSFLKKQADTYTGTEVREVVMGRPVVFSEDPEKDRLAEQRLLNAARKAGFEKIDFLYEPIAAGFLYEQQLDAPETVLIGDFGGGTSDFTLMNLNKDRNQVKDRKSDIVRTGGIHIGGDDFDASIMWHKLVPYFGYGLKYDSYGKQLELPVHIYRTLCEWEQMAFLKEGNLRKSLDTYYIYTNRNPALQWLMTFIDRNLGFKLFQEIEKSKINLSSSETSSIHFQESIINIEETLSKTELASFINKDIQKIDQFLDGFLEASNTDPSSIDTVFLTGGTSSLPSILRLFGQKFGEGRLYQGDNFNSVSQGLALSYLYKKE